MRLFVIFVFLLGLPVFSVAADSSGPDEETKIKLVKYMLKTPMNEADPKIVAGFMNIDTETLPKNLRDKARAKQLEVDGVVKIHNGKKKGPFRYPAACEIKRYEGPQGIRIMGMILGNSEIEWEEEEYLEKKTDCTEEQLICEFSLNVVIMKDEKKPSKRRRFFLLEGDPLMAYVAEKRGGGASAGNRYFQELKPSCQQLAGGEKR